MRGLRPVRAEHAALPILAQGACIRFALTRAWDWLNTPADALVTRKDPLAYTRRLTFYQDGGASVRMTEMSRSPPTAPARAIPGPGGWGALLRMGSHEKELSGGEPLTTNNRMELTAAIQGLNALVRPCKVKLSTDSRYVMDGLTKWVHGWQRNGWKTADKKPVKNAELWHELIAAAAPARGRMGLGQGPCRPPRQRARRPAGERRGRGGRRQQALG